MPVADSSRATQVCTKCGEEKPLEEYYRQGNGTRKRQCKRCVCAQQAAFRQAHPERRAATQRRYKRSPKGAASARATARRRRDRRRKWLDDIKTGQACVDCGGYFPPFVLDFDHVRGEKRFGIGKWLADRVKATKAEVLIEIAKCELRCANCHRIRHAEQLRPARLGESWRDGQMALET